MIKSKYKIIGVMSGTSLDGVDLAYIEFCFDTTWSFEIIKGVTVSYSEKWSKALKNLVSNSLDELREIDAEYTEYLANIISNFIDEYQITDIDAICSHGHTALHQPKKGITYQIGNLPEISKLIGKTVVCDFRVEDVALGGQGAPLVPIGDALLFYKYDYCLNLGGFANISTQLDANRIAYDICPANIVLNHYTSKLGFSFDKNGKIAASGNINRLLLGELNALEFYKILPPKSLGIEWVIETVFPVIDRYNLEIKDILKTFVEHSTKQIALQINKKENAIILCTGGGVYNSFFMKRLNALTNNNIVKPSQNLIEYKEALIFGLLGVLKLRGEHNCLSSVTGAKHNHSSGYIYYP